MKEILFRAKRKDTNMWFNGVPFGDYMIYDLQTTYYGIGGENFKKNDFDNIEIDKDTICQYTGLKDKNGKKIFEGDIFKFPDEVWEHYYTSCGDEYDSYDVVNYGAVGIDNYTKQLDFVKYKYNENSVEADLHENHDLELAEFLEKLEIVGNIYDTPELLLEESDE